MHLCVATPRRIEAPMFSKRFDDIRHRLCICVGRSKIPFVRMTLWILMQRFGEREITGETIKYVLPWTNRGWMTKHHRPTLRQRVDGFGDQLLWCPVAAADHVAGARRG